MKLKKKIKQYGHQAVIPLTKEEMKVYGLKIGDILDISDSVKVKIEVGE